MPRYGVGSTNITTGGSGRLHLTYFTARATQVITQTLTATSTTAAAATPTLCRIGLYAIDGAKAGTLVASTANDTTLWSASFATYTRALTTGATVTAGQRYALGLLVVTAGALPTFYGNGATPQLGATFGVGASPRLSGFLASQTDLPASFTDAALTVNASPMYALLLP